MKRLPVIIIIAAFLLLIACAAGPNEMAASKNAEGNIAGFWQGLWHGFISLFTFIVSLFNKNVNVYEVHNNGGWYNFGFILGVMMFFGGGSGKACHSACSR